MFSKATKIGMLTLSMGLAFQGCTRLSSEKAKVTFQFPSATNVGSSKVSVQSIEEEDGHWGLTDPTSISEIACWAIFVGGPDADLQGQKCYYGPTGNYTQFSFGKFVGLTSGGTLGGTPIELSLNSGPARKFHVMGFKKGSGACPSLSNTGEIDSSQLSSPFMVGQATADLVPGDNKVSINVSFEAANPDNQRIRSCSFFGDRPFTQLRFDGPIQGQGSSLLAKFGPNVCNKLYVSLATQDGGGGGGSVNEIDRNYAISTTGSVEVWTGDGCTGTNISSGSFSIPKFSALQPVYVRATAGGSSTVSFTDTANGFDPVVIQVQGSTGGAIGRANFYTSRTTLAAGLCKELEVYMTDAGGYTWNSAGFTVKAFDLQGNEVSSAASGPDGFVRASCPSGAPTINPSYSGSNSYFKYGYSVTATEANVPTDKYLMMEVGMMPSGQSEPLFINPNKKAHTITLQTLTKSFLSDCHPVVVSGKDSLGMPVNFTSGSNVLPFTLEAFGSQSQPAIHTSISCSDMPMNTSYGFKRSAVAGGTQGTLFVALGTMATGYKMSARAHTFLVADESPQGEVMVNPLWDPTAFGFGLKLWVASEQADGSMWNAKSGLTYPPFNYQSVNMLSYLNGSGSVPANIGDGSLGTSHVPFNTRGYVTFDGATSEQYMSGNLNNLTEVTIAVLARIDSVTAGGLVSASYSGVEFELASDGADFVVNDVGNTGLTLHPKWQVIMLKRRDVAGTYYMSSKIGAAAWNDFGDSVIGGTNTLSGFKLGDSANTAAPFAGAVGEAFVVNRALDASEATQVFNYFCNKYGNLVKDCP